MIVVNKRLRPQALLSLIRRRARACGLTVEELPGRGKGSHRLYVLLGGEGAEVGRINVPHHAREVSWAKLRNTEVSLATVFGDKKWMEDQ